MVDAFGTIISLSFIVLGLMEVFFTEKMYRYNLSNTKYLTVMWNLFTRGNLSENHRWGLLFVKVWGILAIIIGTITLFANPLKILN